MVIEAVGSLPDDDDSDKPDADAGKQISLDDFVKPADWPEDKNWGTLTIDASCTPADITYPTDLKLLNEARESSERIIDDLCDQHSDLRKHKPRYDRGKARAVFLSVAKQKKPLRQGWTQPPAPIGAWGIWGGALDREEPDRNGQFLMGPIHGTFPLANRTRPELAPVVASAPASMERREAILAKGIVARSPMGTRWR